jgi:hypothetical protein
MPRATPVVINKGLRRMPATLVVVHTGVRAETGAPRGRQPNAGAVHATAPQHMSTAARPDGQR